MSEAGLKEGRRRGEGLGSVAQGEELGAAKCAVDGGRVHSSSAQRRKWTGWPGTEGCRVTVKRLAGATRRGQQAGETTPLGRSTRQG